MRATLKQQLRGLLASRRGESLVEVLVSIVVSGLAILMLATTIAAAVHVITENRDFTTKYFAKSNAIVMADNSGGAEEGTGEVTLKSSGDSAVQLEQGSEGSNSITVTYTVSEDVAGEVMASYEKSTS